jgi:histidinol-phosphate aminotransferase
MTALAPRPGVMEITPYVGGESSIPGVYRIIKLASNESALGAPPGAVAAIRAAASDGYRYPDGGSTALRAALGRLGGLDPARIVCGAGSDELIGLLARAYAGPGDEVLYTEHGFLMYPIAARTAGATPVAVPETALTADVDALLATVTGRTRIVFLANPNNPTGTYLPADDLRRLREGLPAHVLLVLDAAYAEYVEAADYDWGGWLVDEAKPTVVTRTFSKIYGLGGLRLGWAYCPDAVADVLNRVRNPFNVSSLAQEAGVAALADQGFVAGARAHNTTWRAWTADALRRLGLEVPAGEGNFVLVRFPDTPGRNAAAADAFLKRRGIIARRMAGYRLPDALRITIGREDEMRACVDALAAFMASAHA